MPFYFLSRNKQNSRQSLADCLLYLYCLSVGRITHCLLIVERELSAATRRLAPLSCLKGGKKITTEITA